MKPALNEKQARAKDLYLRKHYNLTLEKFNALRAHQEYRCAMCKSPEADFKSNLAVDHCHKTGLVRGLLCWLCNKRLGKFSDDHDLLRAAAAYVTNPTCSMLHGDILTAPGRVGTKARAKLLAKLNGITLPKPKKRRTKPSGTRRSRKGTIKI